MSTATDVDTSIFTQIVEDLSVNCDFPECDAAAEVILEVVCPCGVKVEYLLCTKHTAELLERWNNARLLLDTLRGGCNRSYPSETFKFTVVPLNHEH